MRILLDECVPKGLKRGFGPGHLVLTVSEAGWSGTKNGQLLALAASKFDAFVTSDTNLEYQQTLAKSSIVVVVLIARSNDINALRPLVPAALAALETATKGQLVKIGG